MPLLDLEFNLVEPEVGAGISMKAIAMRGERASTSHATSVRLHVLCIIKDQPVICIIFSSIAYLSPLRAQYGGLNQGR